MGWMDRGLGGQCFLPSLALNLGIQYGMYEFAFCYPDMEVAKFTIYE